MVEQSCRYPPHNGHSSIMPPRSAVLLVDDDLALLEALAGTLRFHLGHFTLDTCDTGIKGLAALSATHYGTIITDMCMPGIS